MSGHSKWATIHRQKEVADQKRGQLFTKVANAITIAVRESGGVADPQLNFKLRLAIEKARGINMPRDNIERAIRRAQGKVEGGQLEEVTYEGYGPVGVAVIVECLTDNRQRTTQEIKNIFEKSGGSLGGPGSVSYQFEKSGFLTVEKPADSEGAILKIMDFPGVMEVEEVSDGIEIYTTAEDLERVKEQLTQAGFVFSAVELVMRPKVLVPVAEERTAARILEFMEKIEGQAEVQKVYANFDIPDEILQTHV
jgi:YebC/PmpR family DNA-binding regulatory protein